MFRVNGLLFVFGSFSFAAFHPPCHGSSQALSYVIVDWVSLQEGLWTGSWLCVPPPPPLLSFLLLLLVTGSSFFFFLFLFSEGSLDIKLIIKPVRLCPASQPCPPPSSSPIWGIPAFPWCSYTSCDLTRSDLQASLLYSPPPHFSTCSEEQSVLITSLFLLSLFDNYFLLMLLLRLLLFEKNFPDRRFACHCLFNLSEHIYCWSYAFFC